MTTYSEAAVRDALDSSLDEQDLIGTSLSPSGRPTS